MRSVMGPEERAPAALGGTGSWAVPEIPAAFGASARMFARALVDELADAAGGHRPTSLFQGDRGIAVDLEPDLPGGADALEEATRSKGGRPVPGTLYPRGMAGELDELMCPTPAGAEP